MEESKVPAKRYLLVTADTEKILERLSREGEYPRQDFSELARVLNAEVISYSHLEQSSSIVIRLIRRFFGFPAALALLGFKQKAAFYFTTAENIGMILAFLLKFRSHVTHVMIGHRISAAKKRPFFRFFRLFNRIDSLICYSESQAAFAKNELHIPASKVHRIDFQVDENFFTLGAPGRNSGILSVGRELRDYPTLFKAVEGLNIPVTVVASSPWSRRKDQTRNRPVPENVTLRTGLTYLELRDMYRHAALVVVPLMDVDSPAGVTSILEAQAVARPVIVSHSPGIIDSIRPGETAVTVSCEQPDELKKAILWAMEHREETEEIGKRARQDVLEGKTLDHFLARIRDICARAEY